MGLGGITSEWYICSIRSFTTLVVSHSVESLEFHTLINHYMAKNVWTYFWQKKSIRVPKTLESTYHSVTSLILVSSFLPDVVRHISQSTLNMGESSDTSSYESFVKTNSLYSSGSPGRSSLIGYPSSAIWKADRRSRSLSDSCAVPEVGFGFSFTAMCKKMNNYYYIISLLPNTVQTHSLNGENNSSSLCFVLDMT